MSYFINNHKVVAHEVIRKLCKELNYDPTKAKSKFARFYPIFTTKPIYEYYSAKNIYNYIMKQLYKINFNMNNEIVLIYSFFGKSRKNKKPYIKIHIMYERSKNDYNKY
jgi:hypothetical protein